MRSFYANKTNNNLNFSDQLKSENMLIWKGSCSYTAFAKRLPLFKWKDRRQFDKEVAQTVSKLFIIVLIAFSCFDFVSKDAVALLLFEC